LLYELERQGVPVHRQVLIPIQYENLKIDNGYRIGQLLSYLRLGLFKLGYLLNFNVAHMREGIVSMVMASEVLRPPRSLCVHCGEALILEE
jgi:hypothetical protein